VRSSNGQPLSNMAPPNLLNDQSLLRASYPASIGTRNASRPTKDSKPSGESSVARQRNNISAVVADAVDLTLDTAGTIASMVGGAAKMIGIGSSEPKKSEERAQQEVDDAAERVATSLRQEADAVKPRPRKAKAGNTHVGTKRSTTSIKKAVKSSARKAKAGSTRVGTKRSTKSVKKSVKSRARKGVA
jgi:hypothetical protein